ncbi:MAG: O-antigen ligase family protein [Balneolales bacterium]|nr:O-antigen ligase family protein [Balneolales bacterium]
MKNDYKYQFGNNGSSAEHNYAAYGRRGGWFYNQAINQKLLNPLGYSLFAFIAIVLSVLASFAGLAGVTLTALFIVGVPIIAGCIFNQKFGLIFLLTLQFTLLSLSKVLTTVPLGISFDIVTVALLAGLTLKLLFSKNTDWSYFKSPLGIAIIVWVSFAIAQLFNPAAESQLAWLYTIRAYALIILLYFVFVYTVDSVRFVWILIGLWMSIAFLGALYGLFQDYVGLRQFEWAWLAEDLTRYFRYRQWGSIRKWSFFSGPMVFGLLMGISSSVAIILSTIVKTPWLKAAYIIGGIIMFWAMFTTATRAAYVIPLIVVLTYFVLNFKGKSLFYTIIVIGIGAFFVYMPTDNQRLAAFQSAFKYTADASYDVRVKNWQDMQPFIQSNPVGGGLGSTGRWGQRFSPHTDLAQFPPDSGLVRVAVEMGWLGLFLFLILYYLALRQSIYNHFYIKDPTGRGLSLVFIAVLVSLLVTNLPQESTFSPPLVYLFIFSLAMGVKLKEFYPNENINNNFGKNRLKQ